MSYETFGRFLPADESGFTSDLVGCANSHYWRENLPGACLINCLSLMPVSDETCLFVVVIQHAGFASIYDSRHHARVNFNHYDFGIPLKIPEGAGF